MEIVTNQENMTSPKERNKLSVIDPKEMNIHNEDFKIIILKMLRLL